MEQEESISKKKDLFQALLIDIKKRKPPDKEVQILIVNEEGRYSVTNGRILNAQLRQKESGKVDLKKMGNLYHTGYFAVKWMKLH